MAGPSSQFCKMGLGTCFHPFLPRGRFQAKKGHLIEPDRNSAPRWGIWNCTSRRASFHGIQVGIDIFQGWGWFFCADWGKEKARGAGSRGWSWEWGEECRVLDSFFFFPQILQKPCCILAFVSESECNVMIKSQLGLNKLEFSICFKERVLTGALIQFTKRPS